MSLEQHNHHPQISLISIHTAPSPQAVPLANAFLKSTANKAPVDINLIDFFVGQVPEECAQTILKSRPDAVGFSMYAWNRELCLKIAELLRDKLSTIKLFAGGPEASADISNIINSGIFDYIINGEGEVPFTALCLAMAEQSKIETVPGLQLRGENIRCASTQVADLDCITSPYLSGTLDTHRYKGILWQLSRGCSFSCDFCFDARGASGVRRFSLERLEAELQLFAKTGVEQVFVLDSTFNQDMNRAKSILKMIRKIAPGIHFHFEVRSEFIDREMAGLFAGITCSLQIGLQSSDPAVLKQVGRTFSRNDFVSRINLLNESGAVFGFDLMYGLPGDTLHGFYESIDFALSLYPNHIDIFPLAILPGTALHTRINSDGLISLSTPPYTLISSPTFSIDDMQKARSVATACDVFYTRGKAVAWFNGVMAVLKLESSDLLVRFGKMLADKMGSDCTESDLTDLEVRELQREFLKQTFNTARLKRFQPLVLDLVDYHHHYAAALLAPQTESPYFAGLRNEILSLPLRRSESLQLARYNYEILDIIESGAPDIRWMYDHLQPLGSSAAIYPLGSVVCTESFDNSYYRLLESLDGLTSAGELAIKLGIEAEDATGFLEFAMQEGFVVL